MTWYRVTINDHLWCETSDREEADEEFTYAQKKNAGSRIIFGEWYVPPEPVGHWIDVAIVSKGKTVHDHRLTRYQE